MVKPLGLPLPLAFVASVLEIGAAGRGEGREGISRPLSARG